MMNIKKTKIFKAVASGTRANILKASRKYIKSGKDPNLRDPDTGGNLLHHIVAHSHKFSDPEMLTVVYTLGCAHVDVDAQDYNGDTALHCVVRQRGAYRLMVALIRCGTDTSIQNSIGMTAEDILRQDRPPGHEEMLHWYCKFKPGLWCALLDEKPDRRLVERLLSFWCRLITVKNGEVLNMKTLLQYDTKKSSLLKLVEKYEHSIELAIALLGGQGDLAWKWINEGILSKFDVNICDQSYQFRYPDYPDIPQPLLVAVWETNSYAAVDLLMDLQVNPNTLCSCDQRTIPTPVVFHLFSSSLRPKELRTMHRILEGTDVSVKNHMGQTLLFQAVLNEESLDTIALLLRNGINIGARDKLGRTARDLAECLSRKKYVQAIDNHVIQLIKNKDFPQIERLLLEGYDHVGNIRDSSGKSVIDIARKCSSHQVFEIVRLGDAIQVFVKRVFQAVDEGSFEELTKLLTCKKYAAGRDVCGRTPLLKAILQRRRSLVTKLVTDCQFTINMQDNLGKSVLHYATLFINDPDMIQLIINHGANTELTDVWGRDYKSYSRHVCGTVEFTKLQMEVQHADLDIYSFRTNFERSFREAIWAADLDTVKGLISGLAENGDVSRYSGLLFDCVDLCREDIAVYLLGTGFRADIWKQYCQCSTSGSMCTRRECKRSLMSLKQRALETGCSRVVKVISQTTDIADCSRRGRKYFLNR